MRDDHDAGTLDLTTGGLLIGYARVSTGSQSLAEQRAELKAAGCIRLFEEKASGAKRDRPELVRLLDHLRSGDVVTVTRLDRLARSTRDLLEIADRLRAIGAGLRSLAEPWADTTSPAGRMVLTVFAGIADFERSLILSRTSAGRKAAKARGVRFGRPPALTPDQVDQARRLRAEGLSVPAVAERLRVHATTVYRALYRTQDDAKETWLREEVVPAARELEADPSKALTGDQVREHLTARRQGKRKSL
ncbi:recombinase family protein [Burkholderia multivorans]|uniref:recombinase family protein n=1 Tax=Burkholderia multivorans TaxID=87883 RepID=UPI001C61695B|nr:recombinase family protein [Burkholderia multivorans]